MQIKTKMMVTLASLFLSQFVFAQQNTPIKLAFINNTDLAGTVVVDDHLEHIGPTVNGNGGQGSWIYNPSSYEQIFSIHLMNNKWKYSPCFQEDGKTLSRFNISSYQGDIVKITFTGFTPDGGLYCTCSGSVC